PMNRCPTVPVAPRIATLRLRIAVEFDVSEERRGEPPVPLVDPAQEAQPRRGEVGQHLVVREDAGALQIHHPAATYSGVVLDLLEQELSLAVDVEPSNGDAVALLLGRCRVLAGLRVIALDERDGARAAVPVDRPQEREPLHAIGVVDEVAHKEHSAEGSAEVEVLDPRFDLLGARDQREHLGIEIDSDDAPPHRDQRMGDPARSGPKLQDLGVLGHLAVDELWLVGGFEQAIQIDRRAWVAHAVECARRQNVELQPVKLTRSTRSSGVTRGARLTTAPAASWT